jgi:rubredoxin
MTTHHCNWCGYVYDPAKGDPARGVAPGTPFDALPDDWRCPDCRAPKADFTALDA